MPRPKKTMPEKTYNSGERRLDFFKSFLTAIGKGLEETAKAAGVSKVTISHRWKTDDARIDQLMDLADKFGYKLEIALSGKGVPPKKTVELLADDYSQQDGRFVMKRMAFLSFALREAGITKAELASRLGLTPFSISAWNKKDTITVSRIFDIAQVCGFNVFFTITPKPTSLKVGPDEIMVVADVHIHNETTESKK